MEYPIDAVADEEGIDDETGDQRSHDSEHW